jgi:uncharacterized membrane protein
MAQTATRTRKSAPGDGKSPARRRRAAPPNKNGHGGTGRSAVAKAKKASAKKTTDVIPAASGSRLARRVAKHALKTVASRILESGAGSLRAAAQTGADGIRVGAVRVAEQSREAIQRAAAPQLPIQCAADIAVPLRVAWEEWMRLEVIPEGTHRVHQIERDDDGLFGTIDRPGQPDWHAEILDEREEQSFAWHSLAGSDCAGLVTFHRLSERLTRVELNLDVRPTSAAEAFTLNAHLAHRRAAIELRRFKARIELINPDLYEQDAEVEETAGQPAASD